MQQIQRIYQFVGCLQHDLHLKNIHYNIHNIHIQSLASALGSLLHVNLSVRNLTEITQQTSSLKGEKNIMLCVMSRDGKVSS